MCIASHVGRPRLSRFAGLALLFLAVSASLFAQQKSSDLKIECADLYRFGAFARWPRTAPDRTFTICVIGHDPFGKQLDDALKSESIDGKKVVGLRISSVSQAQQCQVLYVSSSEQAQLSSLIPALRSLPVLTVSDIPQFIDRGGMIGFVQDHGRLRFEVNLRTAEHAGLVLSSQLLNVALRVQR